MTRREQKVMLSHWNKNRGKIVMVIQNKVFSTKSAHRVPSMVKRIEQKFGRRPLITYIPKADTLILWL